MFFNEIEIIKILNLIPGGKKSGNTTVKILKIFVRPICRDYNATNHGSWNYMQPALHLTLVKELVPI